MARLKWTRVRAGHYTAPHGEGEFRIRRDKVQESLGYCSWEVTIAGESYPRHAYYQLNMAKDACESYVDRGAL